jgi:hypothetical protein
MAVYCYNCSIVKLLTIVHLFLCIVYKLSIIMGMKVLYWGNFHIHIYMYIWFSKILSFRHPMGFLLHVLMNKGERALMIFSFNRWRN